MSTTALEKTESDVHDQSLQDHLGRRSARRHSTMSASCLLHPDKRTLIIGFCTSALGQKACSSPQHGPLHQPTVPTTVPICSK
jgi:hypothetical protein